MAVVEFARNMCGMKNANSTEFDAFTPYPVIDMMDEQKSITDKGGTMRLGAYDCVIPRDSICYKSTSKKPSASDIATGTNSTTNTGTSLRKKVSSPGIVP